MSIKGIIFNGETIDIPQEYVGSVNINNNTITFTDAQNNVMTYTAPTLLSEFTNDSGFIDNTVNNLVNYYTQSETYTRAEVLALVADIPKFSVQIVSTLPTENISTTTIYLLAVTDADENNYYEEYLYANNKWELIGTTKIDLSNYYTKAEVDTIVQEAVGNVKVPDNISTTDTDQAITGTKTFNKINLVGEDLVPVYEDREQTLNYEYTVENIPSTNAYGFELNDAGYYESTNKKINATNSYAMCKVSFNMYEQNDLVIELINYAESSYDFGIFSQLDQYLSESYTEDTSSTLVYKSYKGVQSATATTLTYSQVPAGEHFITVKYRKDNSTDSNNDSLQFKILSPIGEVTVVAPELVGYNDFVAPVDIDDDKDLTFNGEKLAKLNVVQEKLENAVDKTSEQTITGLKTFKKTIKVSYDPVGGENEGLYVYPYNTNQSFRGLGIHALGFADGPPKTNLGFKSVLYGIGDIQVGKNGIGVGYNTKATGENSIAIGSMDGSYNKCEANGNNSIQLGLGVNNNSKTFQVFEYQMLNSSGKIPEERMPNLENNEAFSKLSPVAKSGSYDDLIDKIEPASKTNMGLVRAWMDEDGYLCLSTEPLAFINKLKGDTLTINGSVDSSLTRNVLTIN